MKAIKQRFPGGKAGSGVYQSIINQIPPHKVYIEGFLGGGAIMRHKRPAWLNIGIEIDPKIYEKWNETASHTFFNCGFLYYLSHSYEPSNSQTVFIYLDPPYLMSTRKQKRPIYEFEMSENDHIDLLESIKQRREMIAISGYESDLYNNALSDWRKIQFRTTNSAGARTIESLWMNYPKPEALHDYQYLGKNFNHRQAIKRKKNKLREKLLNLDPLERAAILAHLHSIDKNDYETR